MQNIELQYTSDGRVTKVLCGGVQLFPTQVRIEYNPAGFPHLTLEFGGPITHTNVNDNGYLLKD